MAPQPFFTADASLRLSNSRQWPGERDPEQTDVDHANESPASIFIDRFRAELMHSTYAELGPPLEADTMAIDNQMAQVAVMEPYTYPMALLSTIQITPAEDELARLQLAFGISFKNHVFLRDVEIAGQNTGLTPPYLQFACAALASIFSPPNGPAFTPSVEPANLFVTGVHMWIVTLEVDNREARTLEAVLAATLLATWAVISADRHCWMKASGLMCNTITIIRRLHLTDGYSPINAPGAVLEKGICTKSSLVSYMLLVDVMHTIHLGFVPNLTVNELFIRMPISRHLFRNVYSSLTQGYALPTDVTSKEDALLLLVALLSDIIYMQKCHLAIVRPESVEARGKTLLDSKRPVNPFSPLTSEDEYGRLVVIFDRALTRWERQFERRVGGDILALYHFTCIHLLCPNIGDLLLYVRYARPGLTEHGLPGQDLHIPDKAVDLAWSVVSDLQDLGDHSERTLSIWLPVVIFLSALLVWKKLRTQSSSEHVREALSVFKDRLSQFPWPCCIDMVATLENLVRE